MLKLYRRLAGRGLSRWFPTNFFARKTVRNMTGDVYAQVQGFQMKVPIEQDHGMVLYVKGIYEPAVTKFIQFFLKEEQTFVDVGACLGYYSLLASQIVGEKGRVLAFEPEMTNFDYLYHNVALNDCQNVRILNCAASDQQGLANLHISNRHIGCHSLFYSKRSGHTQNARVVDIMPIDKCIDRVDMVKIDVEGWEYYVLKGMESFFQKSENPIIVIMEYCPSLLQENLLLWENLLAFLTRYATKTAVIDEKHKRLQDVSPHQLRELEDRVNVLFW